MLVSKRNMCYGRVVLTMSVKSIHPCEVLVASVTGERPVVRVQLFVSLAVVLPCKALATPRPLALERLLFVVGPHMTWRSTVSDCIK